MPCGSDFDAFRFRIATTELGGRATVGVWRGRKTMNLLLPLLRAPEDPPRNETLLQERQPLSGAVVANLSPALALELERPGAWEGVIVTKIHRNTPAYRLRFRPGDVVLAVNRKEIARVRDLVSLLQRPVDHWAITFSREGRVRTLQVDG